ncbi:MAG: NAD(P)-binding domain-containing protein [Pseudomonadota bacterium]
MSESKFDAPGVPYINQSIEPRLSWSGAVEALRAAHRQARATSADLLIPMNDGELLTRSASIAGFGAGTKTVSIIAGNPRKRPPLPAVQGLFILFEEVDGRPVALIDGAVLTKWKTVADSLLGASLLARANPRRLTLIGAGAMATALAEGYCTFFASLETVRIWSRTPATAARLARTIGEGAVVCETSRAAVADADIIVCATGARKPMLNGAWVKPGAHVDLVGAHGPAMREADDELMRRARLFVDSRETTIEHIGELMIPIASGVITRENVLGDLYDLIADEMPARAQEDITVFKNGGGAHLDLMTARYMLDAASL